MTIRAGIGLELISCAALAAVAVAKAAPADRPPDPGADVQQPQIDEVVVTARFREESVQDVGESISVLSGARLAALGIDTVSKLAAVTPSLNLSDRGPNRNEISIRGVGRALFQQDASLSPANIGLYFDDVPMNSPTGAQLDIRPFDLQRVEVLRGPQGTLFGEGAEGGAIRYVSADPDLTSLHARLEGYGTSIQDGGTAFGGRLMVNAPIVNDSVGVRLVANRIAMPGYIDNRVDGARDTNDYQANNFRAVLLARPTDRWKVRVVGVREEFRQGAFPNVDGDPRDLSFGLSTRGNYTHDDYTLGSANISYRFDPVEVVSISSFFDRDRSREQLESVNSLVSTIFGGGTTFVPSNQIDDQRWRQFSQEVRFISHFDGPVNFVAGAFYRNFKLRITSDARASSYAPFWGQALGTPINVPSGLATDVARALGLDQTYGLPLPGILTNDGRQISAFAEGTWTISDQWRVIAGLRRHDERINAATPGDVSDIIATGAAGPTPPFRVSTKINAVLPKASVEFRPGRRVLAYATYSEGVRNGDLNSPGSLGIIANDPSLGGLAAARAVAAFGSEKAKAVELGLKTEFFDGRLQVNSALYRTKIDNLQGFVIFGAIGGIVANVGTGLSEGAETEVSWKATDHIRLFLGGNYTDSRLDRANTFAAPAIASYREGQRLPFIPRFAGSAGGDLNIPLGATGVDLDGSLVYTYSGDYTTFFQGSEGSTANPLIGQHGMLNGELGVGNERWHASLRVDNMLDTRKIIDSSPLDYVFGGSPPGPSGLTYDGRVVTQPRTATLTLRWSF